MLEPRREAGCSNATPQPEMPPSSASAATQLPPSDPLINQAEGESRNPEEQIPLSQDCHLLQTGGPILKAEYGTGAVPVTNLGTSPINAAPPISEVQGGEGEVIPQTSGDLVEEVGDGNHGSGEDADPTTTVDGSAI